jgi:anti-sigma B factor antagonist
MQVLVEKTSAKGSILRIEGILNAHSGPSLKNQIETLLQDGSNELMIDLSGVDFIDSSGLAVLVSGLKRTHSQAGSLALVGVKPNVMEVFKLTLLDRVFKFLPNLDAALSADMQN